MTAATSSQPNTISTQLNCIIEASEKLEKRVAQSWDTTSPKRQGQITTRLRTAARILYAEGFQCDERFAFVDKLVPSCWTNIKSIDRKRFNNIEIDPIPYQKEEAIRVLRAIKITANVLLGPKVNGTCVVQLLGLEHLSGRPCVLPLFGGTPGRIGSGEAEEILGEMSSFDTSILRCFDTAVTIKEESAESYTMDLVPNWRGIVVRHTWLTAHFPAVLIPTILDYLVEPASSWTLQDKCSDTYTLIPSKMEMSTDTCSAALNKQIQDFHTLGLQPQHEKNWFGVTKFGMVGHVTLTHPSRHELLFVARKDRRFVCYPAVRKGDDAKNYTISSQGMEFISFQILNGTIMINGKKAKTTQTTLGVSTTSRNKHADK